MPRAPKPRPLAEGEETPSKYLNKKTLYRGYLFDSSFEAKLCAILDTYGIYYVRQAPYLLFDKIPAIKGVRRGEPHIVYISDFEVIGPEGPIVLDAKGGKGTQTPAFRLKRRAFMERHPRVPLMIVGVRSIPSDVFLRSLQRGKGEIAPCLRSQIRR